MEPAGQRFITYGDPDAWISLYGISDIHFGNAAVAKERLRRDIEIIRGDPLGFWLGCGDYAEYIPFDDPRFDPECVDDEEITIKDLGDIGVALTMGVARLLRPIAHRCLGSVFGNHEHKYMRLKNQRRLHDTMCVGLDVPNLHYSALFDIVFLYSPDSVGASLHAEPPTEFACEEVWRRRVHVHHGSGWAQTTGGKINRIKSYLANFACDVSLSGHMHDRLAVPRITTRRRRSSSGGERTTRRRSPTPGTLSP